MESKGAIIEDDSRKGAIAVTDHLLSVHSFDIRCMGEARPVRTISPVTHLGCSDQETVGYAPTLRLPSFACLPSTRPRNYWLRSLAEIRAVPADSFFQPQLKDIELLEFTTILLLMKSAQRDNLACV